MAATKIAAVFITADSAPNSVAIAATSIKTTAKPRALGQFRVNCFTSADSTIRAVGSTTDSATGLDLPVGFARTSRHKVEAAILDFLSPTMGHQIESISLLA
jgi:hypothetical protein